MGIILLFRGVYETVYTHLENKIRSIYIRDGQVRLFHL